MPRKARIDAVGALHHIVIRGIERRSIFADDRDREDFIWRLAKVLMESETPCYAWALMRNHVHLLMRTGRVAIAALMRRVLTGYAVSFNRRHRRHGHLFQNRYKSILCEEDPYFRQLVTYIHLNPIRAGAVAQLAALKDYAWTGHSTLMGRQERPWQDTAYVLRLFGGSVSEARRNLQRRMAKWQAKGRCKELTGGGLIRSAGGWQAVKEAYRDGIRISSDERILGSSEFVKNTLEAAGEELDRRMRLRKAGLDLSAVIGEVCRYLEVDASELTGVTQKVPITRARALIGYMATRELAISGSAVARRLNQDRSAVSRAAQRVHQDTQLRGVSSMLMEKLYAQTNQQ
jgi:REP element-mobilizing transposase RayT